MIDWAHYYAALGLRVFPIKPGQKSPPLVPDWPKAATADPAALTAWWESWPGANLGVVTGGGLVDIETDVKPDANGVYFIEQSDMTALDEALFPTESL